MKGIIFNITENFITENYGEDTYEEIIEICKMTTTDPFVGPGTYPDSDFNELVSKSTFKLNMSTHEFLKKLGHFAFYGLANRYPNFVDQHIHPKEFLKTVDGVIHVEVRKLYKGTQLPTFQYAEPSENELIITYYSERRLYSLMEGLISGVAEYFKTTIEQKQRIFSKEDKEFCDFHLIFVE